MTQPSATPLPDFSTGQWRRAEGELLREVVPTLRQLAILANVANSNAAMVMSEAQAAARKLGIEADTFEIRRAEDIAPAFEALKSSSDALYEKMPPHVATDARICCRCSRPVLARLRPSSMSAIRSLSKE